ncbi:MAG: hypothetical protein OEY56_01570 [Cyclobacteriaceae bacterium]|nr:hypothetical protein [Cyclobacteriaceae bacterium]
MRNFRKYTLLVFIMIMSWASQAQCAMCRTQIENNVSHGETSFAAGLNTGILYLFFAPYVLMGIVAYLWFKHSKANGGKGTIAGNTTG